MGVPASVGDPRFTVLVNAANAVPTPVTTQPSNRSTGPKSGAGANGPGLITGTASSSATSSSTRWVLIRHDRRLWPMTTGRLLLGATPLGQPSDASSRLIE